MIKRIIVIALVVAVVAVIANDVWRYSTAQRNLTDATHDIATWAAGNALSMTRDDAALEAARMGAARGVVVYQYDQTDARAMVWTQADVPGTIVAGTVMNLFAGDSFAEASSSPLTIRAYREAGFQ